MNPVIYTPALEHDQLLFLLLLSLLFNIDIKLEQVREILYVSATLGRTRSLTLQQL